METILVPTINNMIWGKIVLEGCNLNKTEMKKDLLLE
jgi:hypothetical protein